jgi:hypothetical protein
MHSRRRLLRFACHNWLPTALSKQIIHCILQAELMDIFHDASMHTSNSRHSTRRLYDAEDHSIVVLSTRFVSIFPTGAKRVLPRDQSVRSHESGAMHALPGPHFKPRAARLGDLP